MRIGKFALFANGLLVGCAGLPSHEGPLTNSNTVHRSTVTANPHADDNPHDDGSLKTRIYPLGSFDIVEIRVDRKPEIDCLASVDLDGRVSLGEFGQVRVEGMTPGQASAAIARELNIPESHVVVNLIDARSVRLYLYGPERNRQRSVSYEGPETVSGMLRRVGLLHSASLDASQYTVVRPNVSAGLQPQVFKIRMNTRDHQDLTIHPGDHNYLMETRRSSFYRLLPEWCKPVYERWLKFTPSDRETKATGVD